LNFEFYKVMDKFLNILKKLIPRKIFQKAQPAYHFLLNWLAALVYKYPSEKMIVVGVTGTTGKTTSVYMTAQVLENAGYKVGYTSTALFSDGEKLWLNDKKMTMVGRFFTQKILSQMMKNGCQYAIVETTSEGIRQYRHRFINYDILVFTGLYPEHIESHGSFENYKQAKGELFAHLKKGKTKYTDDEKKTQKVDKNIKKIDLNRVKKTIIANGDDDEVNYFLDFWAERKIIYTQAEDYETEREDLDKIFSYDDIQVDKKGVKFNWENKPVKLQLLGKHNAQNSVTAATVASSQDIEKEIIIKGLESIKSIAGKMERIEEGQNFTVIVDYAFEPRAMENLYTTLESLDYNNLIQVLGAAGGGRDTEKRPKLGKMAGEKAEKVIVTNEDPYDEDPETIIAQVASGAEYAGKREGKDLFKITDRREAIRKALELARENDIVLITGKGCEQAICLAGGEKKKWDDREVVREELRHPNTSNERPNDPN